MDEDFDGFRALLKKLKPSPYFQLARYRQGSEASDWAKPGGVTYIPVGGFLQVGSAKWSGPAATSGKVTVNFFTSFKDRPLVLVTAESTIPLFQDVRCQAPVEAYALEIYWFSSTPLTQVCFHWWAFGPLGT